MTDWSQGHSIPTVRVLPHNFSAMNVSHGQVDPDIMTTDFCLDEIGTTQSNINQEPTLTNFSFNTLMTDNSLDYDFPGLTAMDSSFGELVADTSQDYILSGSTVTDFSLNELVGAQSDSHIGSTLTDNSQGQDFPVLTAVDFSFNEPKADITQGCNFPSSNVTNSFSEEPTTRDFKRWKDSWNEKMLLVRLKREKRDWEYIIKVFWRMDKKPKEQSGWKSMWQRAEHDVRLGPPPRFKLNERTNLWVIRQIELLGVAARADLEGELGRLGKLMPHHSLVNAARIDHEGIWTRISELMEGYDTECKWTPGRVEYAWTHGVSNLFPDTVLRQRQFYHHVSADEDVFRCTVESLV